MNEDTLLPGNRNYSHKFRTMPIKHPHCGRFVTLITDAICYPLNIKYICQCVENFHQYLYPRVKVIPALTRNGFNGDFHEIAPVNLFSMLLSSPQAETLLKEGNISMLKYMARNTIIFHAEYDRFLKTGSEFACEIEHALKADTVG